MKKVLIANRGEIAVRIIRACHTLGLAAVAVYSTADKEALHVRLADEAVCIGPPEPAKSYLKQNNIIEAAKMTGADLIHPGYGFLSENAEFAQKCEDNKLKFVGPSAQVIALMGEKATARQTMKNAGVPVIPGSPQGFLTVAEGLRYASMIEFPVMLKASAGGGGKGMRVIQRKEDFAKEFTVAQQEAQHAFSNSEMYLEKYLPHPRHIEVQLMADQFGNVLGLRERDCTLQLNHQKILEEAPALMVSNNTLQKMLEVSIRAAKKLNYEGAGTMEFLLDGPKNFYFMEMNTRIQVEHPVTELITNTDLVEMQLRVALGKKVIPPKMHLENQGFALECRINARGAGKITALHLPSGYGVRVDTAIYQGYRVPPNYDAMIAKIIVHGHNRENAIALMKTALDETVISGIQTNLDFLAQLLEEPEYLHNETDVNWLEKLTDAK
ncbi:biotin carboxylase of acetyl-CoA carboxylase [Liquorilactobacillus sucicola DSM 21376 = JCM 15457]|uniref:acetyl-CoA carboxylase biotin carboxylase subunit n=1 Tax=Liquorilactobacillus sucicola TaxID=519050 RepID=UPI0004317020|nr:acetyl-CoA carboxylase biotin carboxylase subunit [Liquorilactobacillus sucicola]GAJ25759.1 biotin carboxylase of acetyl-CoA carboxylase [Liquorilactobacillus sucicola DSM 21376 = JCM 15457]